MNTQTTQQASFAERFNHFYAHTFLPEHQHPATVALHHLGVVLGLVSLVAAALAASKWSWLALLFPLVHAAPGLIAHRLFERNAVVGDVRITRKDYPLWWFILANHRMAWQAVKGLGR